MRSSSLRTPYGHDRVELAREIQRMAVRQVAAVREIHPEHRVARLQQREVHGHVRLRAGVRLHVGVLGAEQLLRAVDGERFGDVDELAAAVVALARIAFGVFVRQHRARRLQDRLADEILRRDQLEAVVLPVQLVANGLSDLGIGVREVRSDVVGASAFNVMIFQSPRSDRGVSGAGRPRTACPATA